MGGTAKERAVENRGTRSLVIPAWLRCLSSLSAKVAKVKMKGAIFSSLLPGVSQIVDIQSVAVGWKVWWV